jgi:hypothetical protein
MGGNGFRSGGCVTYLLDPELNSFLCEYTYEAFFAAP